MKNITDFDSVIFDIYLHHGNRINSCGRILQQKRYLYHWLHRYVVHTLFLVYKYNSYNCYIDVIYYAPYKGILGKVLLEKLLRSCPDINRLYLLMREKKGKFADKRIHDLRASIVRIYSECDSITYFPIKNGIDFTGIR